MEMVPLCTAGRQRLSLPFLLPHDSQSGAGEHEAKKKRSREKIRLATLKGPLCSCFEMLLVPSVVSLLSSVTGVGFLPLKSPD